MANETSTSPRRVAARRWLLLGTAAAAGIAVAAPSIAASGQGGIKAPGKMAMPFHLAAAAQGGEGGEGGEGGAVASDDDAGFLSALGEIEGHLRAGIALYEIGEAAMARSHMKHPGDEIYSEIVPGLETRKAEPFADELAALSAAVEGGASVEEARSALDAVLREIQEARERTGGGEAARLRAAMLIVRDAAEEYAEGVKDGRIVETHEYQDAWGFVQAARAMIGELEDSSRPEVAEALARYREQFAEIEKAFPALRPAEGAALADPSLLYGAAARMELAALPVR